MPGGSTFGAFDMEIHFVGEEDIEGKRSPIMQKLGDQILQESMKTRQQILMLTHVADEAVYLLRLMLEGESGAYEKTVSFLRQYPKFREAYGSPDVQQ